jgi:hypothetical protein
MTACFASEPMRGDRFEEMVDSVPYAWVWMDQAWLPEGSLEHWSPHGAYNWYAYQWHTNATVKRFYGLIV